MNKLVNGNGIIKSMLEHPIASFFLIDVTLCGVANIIKACKTNPNVQLVTDTVELVGSAADD